MKYKKKGAACGYHAAPVEPMPREENPRRWGVNEVKKRGQRDTQKGAACGYHAAPVESTLGKENPRVVRDK
jgi:hypothetical protein